MHIDVVIEDPRWADAGLDLLAARAGQAVAHCIDLPKGADAALLACDDTRIADLNADFRGKPAPTNVLSWPSTDIAPDPATGAPPPITDPELGDMAISFDTCASEALQQSKGFEDHVIHLIVHGLLHLCGYDHEKDQEAAVMEQLEIEILANLNISNPYEIGEQD